MDKYYIKLETAIYEVRVNDGHREVQSNGVWMSHDDFVDQLANAGHWGQLSALCKAACILKPEEAERILAAMRG
jgi:hypothetical protein